MRSLSKARYFFAHCFYCLVRRESTIISHLCVFVDYDLAVVLKSDVLTDTAFCVDKCLKHFEVIEICSSAFLSTIRHNIIRQIVKNILPCSSHRLIVLKALPEGQSNGILIQIEGIRNASADGAFSPIRMIFAQILLVFLSDFTNCVTNIHYLYLRSMMVILYRIHGGSWSHTERLLFYTMLCPKYGTQSAVTRTASHISPMSQFR